HFYVHKLKIIYTIVTIVIYLYSRTALSYSNAQTHLIEQCNCSTRKPEPIRNVNREPISGRMINDTFYMTDNMLKELTIPVLVVIDQNLYHIYGSATENWVKKLFEDVSETFQWLKVNVTVAGIHKWTHGSRIYMNQNAFITLDHFANYNSLYLRSKYKNCYKHAMLLTYNYFTKPINNRKAVEIASLTYYGKICHKNNFHSISIVSALYSKRYLDLFMAHELACNLGIKENSRDCETPSTSINCTLSKENISIESESPWSQCSKQTVLTIV
ncbi:hypothetical protein B4U79_18746, partial [Dinothrombium tinctorium]